MFHLLLRDFMPNLFLRTSSLLVAAATAKLPPFRVSSNFAILSSFLSSSSLQSLIELPAAELQSEVSFTASALSAVISICDDLISRCKRCDGMQTHEAELKDLAAQVTALLDLAATASAALDSAIECQARVCAAASSKFLQLEFRIRGLENQI